MSAVRVFDSPYYKTQLKQLLNGTNYSVLLRPCTVDDGIISIDDDHVTYYISLFDQEQQNYNITKFVPASGAGSRMFKQIFEKNEEALNKLTSNKNKIAITFKEDPSNFFDLIKKYSVTPKGLIPFHLYDDKKVTAFEEQIEEGLLLKEEINFHFTISKDHQASFQNELNKLTQKINTDQVSFSYQDESTDTISINENNEVILNKNGSVYKRPGGHGALINNLQKIDADVIIIKNIDNIQRRDNHLKVNKWKKILAGLLIDVQNKIYSYQKDFEEGNISETALKELKLFIKSVIKDQIDIENFNLNDFKNYINRPIRVCGMVKNIGLPGGGPFWVKTDNGISKQIIEGAQIDKSNSEQLEILNQSTHFNPVDIVCSIKNYKGQKYDLDSFIDTEAYFVSEKSKEGQSFKTLEHPGLWNGAMSGWITIFVEVPLHTFSPVKTVLDLLKPEHLE